MDEMERVFAAARSGDPHERGMALQVLRLEVEERPELHGAARQAFESALRREKEPWHLISAARGLERIVGGEAARAVWLDLLRRTDERVAAHAAIAVNDAWFVPELLARLEQEPGETLRINLIFALGWLKDTRAIEALLRQASSPEPAPRAHAARALGALGDPRAIPALRALLTDEGPAWPIDNHGPMVLIREVAAEAIAALERGPRDKPSATWLAPTLPVLPAVPLPAETPSMLWPSLTVYLPLVVAVLEIPFLFIVVQAMRDAHPHPHPHPVLSAKEQNQRVDLIGAIPPALAILVTLLFVWPRFEGLRWWERAALIAGTLACGAFLYALGKEYVRAGP